MNTPILIGSFIFGTLWGSFFYTLALRYASGMIAESPFRALTLSSRCPSCGKAIKYRHLVPVLGYISLRGHCGHCGAVISPLYPAFEILIGITCAAIIWRTGLNPLALAYFLLAGIAATISVIDLKTMTIPNTLVAAFLVLSVYPIILQNSWKDTLYGGLFMSVFFLAVLLAFPGSFGGGDLKYATVIGIASGLEYSILVLEVSLITGAVAGVIYAITSGKSLRTKIPFAPFLGIGFLTAMLFGREIILIYYRIVD